MIYRVPAKQIITVIYEVKAKSKLQAMDLVLEESPRCKFIEEIDGDVEVYYPDITEVSPVNTGK